MKFRGYRYTSSSSGDIAMSTKLSILFRALASLRKCHASDLQTAHFLLFLSSQEDAQYGRHAQVHAPVPATIPVNPPTRRVSRPTADASTSSRLQNSVSARLARVTPV